MRPCVTPLLLIRDTELGGPKPLFCMPIAASDIDGLLSQARLAQTLKPDVVEWLVDSYDDISPEGLVETAERLRSVLPDELIVFTLRMSTEGGAKVTDQHVRSSCIDQVLRSEFVDLVELEMSNSSWFLEPLIRTAHAHAVRIILSFHNFKATPSNALLLMKISKMVAQCADIAKIACMPKDASDVLRLLEVTHYVRQIFPAVPLCTMSMGNLGCLSRGGGLSLWVRHEFCRRRGGVNSRTASHRSSQSYDRNIASTRVTGCRRRRRCGRSTLVQGPPPGYSTYAV